MEFELYREMAAEVETLALELEFLEVILFFFL